MDKTGISFFYWPLTWLLIKISLTRPSRNCNPRFWLDHVYMIGGVTRHKLPHLSGVPRLRVNRPKWYKAFITYSVALNLSFFSFFSRSAKSPSPQGEYLWENENCTVVIADPFFLVVLITKQESFAIPIDRDFLKLTTYNFLQNT